MFAPVPLPPSPPFSHGTTGGGPTYTLICSSGTFNLSGQVAGLTAARNILAGVGLFVLSGQDAGLSPGPTPSPSVIVYGGGADPETWRDRIRLRMEERNAALILKRKRVELRRIDKQIAKLEAKTPELPLGVLAQPARLVELSIRRDEVAAEIERARLELQAFQMEMALALSSFEAEDDDEEVLLLL